ncbi:MAG TPA: hypothetical protein VEA79_12725 [Phenylobacterium sp.]|nr:hypothetical protein [Phenylobacterium sp.]
MRRLLALAAVATGLAAVGPAAACERYDPCRKPPPRIGHYEHRYVEREAWRPRVEEVRLPGDFFYGAGGVEAPMGGDFYYGGGYVIAGSNASSFAGASAFASARASVSVSTRFRGGHHHGGKRWGGHKGGKP